MFCFCMPCFPLKCASVTLVVFSVLSMITASVTIYLATRLNSSQVWNLQSSSESELSDSSDYINTVKPIVFWGIIGLCIMTIVTVGILGILTAKYKSCCAIGSFAFFSLISWVAYWGIGTLLILVTIASG